MGGNNYLVKQPGNEKQSSDWMINLFGQKNHEEKRTPYLI